MRKFIIIIFAILVFGFLQLPRKEAQADKLSLIRDTETETGIRELTIPLIKAANLDSESIKYYIVNNPAFNAFVAGGQNIFIHTGLLSNCENVSQLIGVLAHELGHIAGGHLSKLRAAQNKASNEALIGTILAGAAALLGNPSVATALSSGGLHIGKRNLLSFTRSQELSADRAALRYLDLTRQSAKGLVELAQKLRDQELLTPNYQDPYVRTHPISQRRFRYLASHLASSAYTDAPTSNRLKALYLRIKAKIKSFTQPTSQTLREYQSPKPSIQNRYARTIAYYRQSDLEKSLKLIDGLIEDMPDDAYFHELKGQILFETGFAKKALFSYEVAVRLAPEAHLIRADLGRIQLELNDPNLLPFAIRNFQMSLEKEPKRAFIWRQLGIALGRLNKMGKSFRALAEEALLRGRDAEALRLAKKAKNYFHKGSSLWLRSEDIIFTIKQKKLGNQRTKRQ